MKMTPSKTLAGTKRKRGGKGSLIGEGPTGKLKKDVSVYKKRMEALEKARSTLKRKRAMKKKGSK